MPIKTLTFVIFLLTAFVQNTLAQDLFSAAKKGNVPLIEKLIKKGADVTATDNSNKSPLDYALAAKHFAAAKALLKHTEEFNIFTLVEQQQDAKFKFYRDNNVNVTYYAYADPKLKQTYLMHYAKQGDAKALAFLLKHGAEVNAKDIAGNTAMFWATDSWSEDDDPGTKRAKCIKLLLQQKANIEEKNNKGETALLKAATYDGNAIVIETLLKAKAHKNAQDKKGMTALMHAVHRHSLPSDAEPTQDASNAKILLKYKANINSQDNQGMTALMHAAHSGYMEAVKLLIKHGAHMYLKDKQGNTALYHALSQKREETAKILFNAASQ